MGFNLEKLRLVAEEDKNSDGRDGIYTRDDVIGFFYSLLSALCLAISAVFVKLLEG